MSTNGREKMTRWEVVSDVDDGVVFDADSVEQYAQQWRMSNRSAAKRFALENEDPLTDETLFVRAVNDEWQERVAG